MLPFPPRIKFRFFLFMRKKKCVTISLSSLPQKGNQKVKHRPCCQGLLPDFKTTLQSIENSVGGSQSATLQFGWVLDPSSPKSRRRRHCFFLMGGLSSVRNEHMGFTSFLPSFTAIVLAMEPGAGLSRQPSSAPWSAQLSKVLRFF